MGQHVRVQARATAGRVLENDDVGYGQVEPSGDGLDRGLDGGAEGIGLGLVGAAGCMNGGTLRRDGQGGVERGALMVREGEGVDGVERLGR
jgi:hypothetical protein